MTDLSDAARRPTPPEATAAVSDDPAVGLRAVRSLRTLAERLEALQVGRARALGWSWQEIADGLGVSRQAVHKKHGTRRGTGLDNGKD